LKKKKWMIPVKGRGKTNRGSWPAIGWSKRPVSRKKSIGQQKRNGTIIGKPAKGTIRVKVKKG